MHQEKKLCKKKNPNDTSMFFKNATGSIDLIEKKNRYMD
jgi:hypothetical protein